MVWDGLRPDFISADLTPNLLALAGRGVRFTDSHALFPTVTRCNSASIATGALPATHGIPGNSLYAPTIDPTRALNTGDHRTLDALRGRRGGRVLLRRTLAEHVSAAGGSAVVAGTGSPGSSLLQHPQAEDCGNLLLNPALFIGRERDAIEAVFGPVPERSVPCSELNAYFTGLLTDFVLPEIRPTLLTFWHTDPDATQHRLGLGHPDAARGIADADRNLGAILDAIERLGLTGETDVVVVSDHGFSTIGGRVDVAAALVEAGVKESTESMDVVVTDGFVYVPDGKSAVVERAVAVLRELPGVGALFTGARGAPVVEGTLPVTAIGADGYLAPEVIFSLDWSDEANERGTAGTCWAPPSGYVGMHGSLSPWEVHNTLVAAGPAFKRGAVSDVPAGNADITPTLLHTLGLDGAGECDGRVLEEALAGGPDPASLTVERETLTAEHGGFAQALRVARVGGARYVDFGKVERA